MYNVYCIYKIFTIKSYNNNIGKIIRRLFKISKSFSFLSISDVGDARRIKIQVQTDTGQGKKDERVRDHKKRVRKSDQWRKSFPFLSFPFV